MSHYTNEHRRGGHVQTIKCTDTPVELVDGASKAGNRAERQISHAPAQCLLQRPGSTRCTNQAKPVLVLGLNMCLPVRLKRHDTWKKSFKAMQAFHGRL